MSEKRLTENMKKSLLNARERTLNGLRYYDFAGVDGKRRERLIENMQWDRDLVTEVTVYVLTDKGEAELAKLKAKELQ